MKLKRSLLFIGVIETCILYGDSSIKEWGSYPINTTEEHSEMAGYYFDVLEDIQEPEAIYEGKVEELLAVKEIEPGKHLVVVYREMNREDGLVITAFLTRRFKQIERRTKLWP